MTNTETAVNLLLELEGAARHKYFYKVAPLLKRMMQPFGITLKNSEDVFTEEDTELLKEFWRALLDPLLEEELLPRAILVYICLLAASIDSELPTLQSMAAETCTFILTLCGELVQPEERGTSTSKVVSYFR